jgi:hypothetical protein
MREEINTRNLPVNLTQEEVAAKSQALAAAIKDREELQLRLSSVQTAIKGEIKIIDLKVQILTSNVLDKVEYREVEIIEERDNVTLTMRQIRADTREVVGTRPMSENERQLVMFPAAELRAVESGLELTKDDLAAIAGDPEVAI